MENKRTSPQPSGKGPASYCTGTVQVAIRPRRRLVKVPVQRWFGMVKATWRRRPRDPVSQLDDYILRDLCLTREDVWHETTKLTSRE